MPSSNHFAFTDDDGTTVEISIHSTGAGAVELISTTGRVVAGTLTAKAAHDLRDMLNRRFPA